MVDAYEVRPREAARLCAIVNMDGRSALGGVRPRVDVEEQFSSRVVVLSTYPLQAPRVGKATKRFLLFGARRDAKVSSSGLKGWLALGAR